MDDAITGALHEHAVSIRETALERTHSDAAGIDVASVFGPLDGIDIVGLGEATHGSRELFGLKRRIIRSLVERHGFRTVALEADVTATLSVDDYVSRETADREAALAGLDRWMWKSEEVWKLLQWLRSFNEGRPNGDRARIRGLDLSAPSAPVPRIRSYLSAVDPAYAAGADELTTLVEFELPSDDEGCERRLEAAVTAVNAVVDRLDERRETYVGASSEVQWRLARHLCHVVERTCEWHRVRHEYEGPHADGMAERDRRMSEHVTWCLERDTGNGVVVWAHNGHVQRGTFDDGQPWAEATTMGERLDREFGSRYRPLGFDFGTGSFRALDGSDTANRGPRRFAVGEPLDGSATAYFDALNTTLCGIDFETAADDPRLEPWLERPRRIRRIGSVYDPDADPAAYTLRTNLPASFDGLVFFEESTPSRPVDAI